MSGRSNRLLGNNLAWVYAFLWLLPYLKQLRGRILGTQLASMSRSQLRQKQEESTQTYMYKEVRAEAFAPGDDSLVYFQLFVGTQRWGLIQNQSSFLKRVMERTPQPCPFDTQRPQARWPWKQTQAQLKEQLLPEESRASQKCLIKSGNDGLTGCSAQVEKTTVADCKSIRALVWQHSACTQQVALQKCRGEDGAAALPTLGAPKWEQLRAADASYAGIQ